MTYHHHCLVYLTHTIVVRVVLSAKYYKASSNLIDDLLMTNERVPLRAVRTGSEPEWD